MQLSIEIDEFFLSGNSFKSCGNSSVFSCVSCGSLCSHCQKICFHVKNNEVSSSILLAHNSKSEFIKQESTTNDTDSIGSDIIPQPKRQRKFVSLLCCIITQALDNRATLLQRKITSAVSLQEFIQHYRIF